MDLPRYAMLMMPLRAIMISPPPLGRRLLFSLFSFRFAAFAIRQRYFAALLITAWLSRLRALMLPPLRYAIRRFATHS